MELGRTRLTDARLHFVKQRDALLEPVIGRCGKSTLKL